MKFLLTLRGRKVFESRNINDDEKIQQMEKELEETIRIGEEADKNYEEVNAACFIQLAVWLTILSVLVAL